ncbi:hypothetical protein AB0J35_57825 [Nonomuraea angiospora]|uniref:hypothetical protein n=1 Tax=Nonomuraea angiospora TaxID=46172 RepID=UPI003447BCDF
MAKFTCERYPNLVMHDGEEEWARFEDGVFETSDTKVAARLRKAPDVVEVTESKTAKGKSEPANPNPSEPPKE